MDTIFQEDSGFFSSTSTQYCDELETESNSEDIDEQVTDDKGLSMLPLNQPQLLADSQTCNNNMVQKDNFDCLYEAIVHKHTVNVHV